MNLRSKTFLIVAIVVAVGTGVIAAVGQLVIKKSFHELEDREAQFHANRVQSIVATEQEFLSGKVGDWGIWDDAYEFVMGTGDSKAFIDANFPDLASSTMKVGFVAMANHAGKVLGSNAYDYHTEKPVPLADGIIKFLSNPTLHKFAESEPRKSGILRLPEGVLIYAAMQIRTSDETKAAPGTVIMGNWVDDLAVAKFAKSVQLDLSYEAYPIGVSPKAGTVAANLTSDHATSITAVDSKSLNAQAMFFDEEGSPAVSITAKLDREILARGEQSIKSFILLLSGGGMILTLLLTILIQRGVVARIVGLGRAVTDIGERHDLSARVPEQGKDEIQSLSKESNGMLKTISEKTGQMRTILTHINQGIIMVDQDGVVRGETSSAFGKMTGVSRADGRKIEDIILSRTELSADVRSQIDAFINNSVGEDVLNFEANRDILPREVTFQSGQQRRIFETDWLPITSSADVVEAVMMTLRDVTELRALREASERSRGEMERLMQIIGQPAQAVEKFFQSTSAYLASNRQAMGAVQNPDDLTEDRKSLLRRNLHTLKGNARAMGFSHLTEVLHEAEDKLFLLLATKLTSGADEHELRNVLADQTKKIEGELSLYQGASSRLIAHGKPGHSHSHGVDPLKLDEIVSRTVHFVDRIYANGKLPTSKREALELKFLALSLRHESLASHIKGWEALAISLAQELSRKSPHVIFKSDGDFILTQEAEAAISDGMMHMIRNSMDHGFKDGAVMPEITITANQQAGGRLKITYRDNGVGLNLAKIRSVAAQKGTDVTNLSDTDVAELIFVDGVSTSDTVSEISGRGTGMAAVRSFLDNLGGHCKLQLDSDNNAYGNRGFYLEMEIAKGGVLYSTHDDAEVSGAKVKLVNS